MYLSIIYCYIKLYIIYSMLNYLLYSFSMTNFCEGLVWEVGKTQKFGMQ